LTGSFTQATLRDRRKFYPAEATTIQEKEEGQVMRVSRRMYSLVSIIMIAGLLAGCAHIPGGISDSTTPINGRKYVKLGHVSRTDSYILLLGILPISGSNSIREVIDAATRARGGDALIDVTVESYFQWWILFTRLATRVEGEAIRFQE
jgi:hypothetical protein